MLRKIFKTGNSLAVTVSKKILEELDLKVGDTVSVEPDKSGERILIKAEKRNSQLAMNLNSRPSLGSQIARKK